MIWAYLCAFACAVVYGLGSVLQSVAAKRVEAGDTIDPRGLAKVATQLPYVAGVALDAVGFVLSLVALARLPVFVVQALVAGSIAFVVLFSSIYERTRPTGRQLLFVGILLVGLAVLGVTGAPDKAHQAPGWFSIAMWVAVVLIAIGAVIVPRRLSQQHAAAAFGALAGLAFGGTALCARSITSNIGVHTLSNPQTFALAAFGILGLALYAAGLQRGSVTVITAWVYTTETIAPAIIGALVLGDHARSGMGPVAVAAFIVTVGAAVMLSLVSPPHELAH